jgi:hypothetical protein
MAHLLLCRSAKITNKNGGKKMENEKEFSTCLENIPFAEMMQKMVGKKGVGSLCAEMMKQVREKQGGSCSVHCTEMMQSMMKGCSSIKQESKEAKEEAGHVRNK